MDICNRCKHNDDPIKAECSVCANRDRYEEKITNADRIRAMSDEELAEWVERIRVLCANEYCGKACPLFEICMSSAEKPTEVLDWLRQEAQP